jgi:PAS domain S-box-containing protein
MRERARELKDSKESLRQNEQTHEEELETLQQVATQGITASGIESLYDQILDAALAILHADLASIQMVHPERGGTGELKLLSHRGFSPQVVKRWEWVGMDSRTTCGEALRTGRRVIVPDVRNCEFMAGSEDLEAFLDAGIHAAQSVPLVSRSGALLGIVTTYWRHPHGLSSRELGALNILARLAADVIERTMVAEALWEKQQRLASIYDTIKDVIFHLGVEPDGKFRFASINPAFLRVTGLSREAVVGKTVNEVIPESSLAMVLAKYRQAIEEHTTVVWEETSDYPTGRLTGEVSVTPVLDKTGKCTHLVGSVHDITERKRAETALRESEERFRTMANAAPVMIWVSGDKLLMFFNRGWLEFTGRMADEKLGNGWLADVHPDDVDRCYEAYSASFAARRRLHMEYRLRRADGVYRWVLSTMVPRFAPGGVFEGYLGSAIDITDLKQSHEKILAVQKLESLGVMAAGVAHDFSNLLSTILMESEFALEQMDADSPGRAALERISGVANGAVGFVQLLLTTAGAGIDPNSRELVDISAIAEETILLLKGSISKRAVVQTNFTRDLSPVQGNVAQIRQVVMNLITNASEAIGDKEGKVTVSTERVTIRPDSGAGGAEGEYVRLTISDTGCGMTPETRAKIFDQFFTTKTSGRGLGLAAVHGIVRSMEA